MRCEQREARRFEVTHVPAPVRNRDRLIGIGEAGPAALRAHRVREGPDRAPRPAAGRVRLPWPSAARRHASTSPSSAIAICCVEGQCWWTSATRNRAAHAVLPGACHPGRQPDAHGERRVVSKRMLYVEIDAGRHRPPPALRAVPGLPAAGGRRARRRRACWRGRSAPGSAATWNRRRRAHAVANVVPEHLAEVRSRKLDLIAKTEAAVKDRLTKEITYWDHRAEQLKLQEQAGKPMLGSTPARPASGPTRCRRGLRSGWTS